jgi:hypothetical protein
MPSPLSRRGLKASRLKPGFANARLLIRDIFAAPPTHRAATTPALDAAAGEKSERRRTPLLIHGCNC